MGVLCLFEILSHDILRSAKTWKRNLGSRGSATASRALSYCFLGVPWNVTMPSDSQQEMPAHCIQPSQVCFSLWIRAFFHRRSRRSLIKLVPTTTAHTFSSSSAPTCPEASSSAPQKLIRSNAVHELSYLISEANARSKSPRLQSPHDIKAFYRAVKAKSLAHQLLPEDFSSLIRLFGSMSLPSVTSYRSLFIDDSGNDFRFHPLTSALVARQTTDRTHWAFILSVAKDKVAAGYRLNSSDNFWLMSVAFADAARFASGSAEGTCIFLIKRVKASLIYTLGSVEESLDRARSYYLNIQFKPDDWQLHHFYLERLFSFGEKQGSDGALRALCRLLEHTGQIHARLRPFVWRCITSDAALKPKTKTRFLEVVRKRVGRLRDVLPLATAPNIATMLDSEAPRPEKQYDAAVVRDYLAHILFSRNPGTSKTLRYMKSIYPWALFEIRAALCAFNDGSFCSSEEEDKAAWRSLGLLAVSYLPREKARTPSTGLDGGIESQGQVLGWTIICMLSAITSELARLRRDRNLKSMPSADVIRDIARSLWVLWRKEEAWRAGAVMRQPSLICSTVSSFMSLAALSDDSRLASSLVRHIADAVIYPAQFGQEILDRRMLVPIAVQYGILHFSSRKAVSPEETWVDLFRSLQYAQLLPDGSEPNRWRDIVASKLLMEYASLDSMHAFQLSRFSVSDSETKIDACTILEIGKELAEAGNIREAFACLSDERLDATTADILFDSVLQVLSSRRPGSISEETLRGISNVLLSTTIRPLSGQSLETILEAALRGRHVGNGAVCYEIVRNIWDCKLSNDKPLLSSQFLALFASELAKHRHYKRLGQIMNQIWSKSPNRLSSMCRAPQLHYVRSLLDGAQRTSSKEIAKSLPFSVYIWPILRGRVPFSPRLAQAEKKIISLKISSNLGQAKEVDYTTLERAIFFLVQNGRISMAMRLADKMAPSITTKAGNIILSGSLLPRPGRRSRRQIRHACSRLEQLVKERGFIPDRITFNLLIKALLRWPSVTPLPILQSLFERLTVSGYDIPQDIKDTLRIDPRRMTQTDSQITLPIDLKSFPSKVSFRKHTRPLFQMFVKAFKNRGDIYNAKRIAVALHRMALEDRAEWEKREEARRLGRIRAREKRRKRLFKI